MRNGRSLALGGKFMPLEKAPEMELLVLGLCRTGT